MFRRPSAAGSALRGSLIQVDSCAGRCLTHGQVIDVLVANRPTAPAPLWRVDVWAREWAVEEVFGIEPELLNDGRLGRALDAIAPHLEEITASIGARAIGEFGQA